METTKKGKPKAKGNGQGTIYKMSNGKLEVNLLLDIMRMAHQKENHYW